MGAHTNTTAKWRLVVATNNDTFTSMLLHNIGDSLLRTNTERNDETVTQYDITTWLRNVAQTNSIHFPLVDIEYLIPNVARPSTYNRIIYQEYNIAGIHKWPYTEALGNNMDLLYNIR